MSNDKKPSKSIFGNVKSCVYLALEIKCELDVQIISNEYKITLDRL